MARYFFDLSNGEGLTEDEAGVELLSPGSIRTEVSRILTGIAGEEMLAQECGTVGIEVRDERGQFIFEGKLTYESRWCTPMEVKESPTRS